MAHESGSLPLLEAFERVRNVSKEGGGKFVGNSDLHVEEEGVSGDPLFLLLLLLLSTRTDCHTEWRRAAEGQLARR